MPTFNPDAKCPQCGHDKIGVTYADHRTNECQSIYAPLGGSVDHSHRWVLTGAELEARSCTLACAGCDATRFMVVDNGEQFWEGVKAVVEVSNPQGRKNESTERGH